MRRVKVTFKDGEKTYAEVDTSREKPIIILAGNEYQLEDFAATGAMVAVNDNETLRILQEAGIYARPTGKQVTITISVTQDFKDRIAKAAAEYGIKTTNVLVEAGNAWLTEHGY